MLEHPVMVSWEYLFNVLFLPWRGPVIHLWFVETLFLFFLLMPLYKWTLNNKWTAILWIVVLWWLTTSPYQYLGIDARSSQILCLDSDCRFWIFFYLGMVVQKFDLTKYIQPKWALLVSCPLYYVCCVTHFGGANIIGIVGIVYIVSLSYFLASKWPTLFSSYSKYTYQIYLMHMLPIMAFKYIYHRNLMDDTIWFPLCWTLSLLSAIYLPTMVAKIAERCPKHVRMLIGL